MCDASVTKHEGRIPVPQFFPRQFKLACTSRDKARRIPFEMPCPMDVAGGMGFQGFDANAFDGPQQQERGDAAMVMR